jgi:2-oxoglutarate ferredoxin oxidoreductase subunit beta
MSAEAAEKTLAYQKPGLINDNKFHFCPGCTYGIIIRLIASALEEMKLEDKAIGLVSAGCYVQTPWYLDVDFVAALHGRAPAVATGIRRVHPDSLIFCMQGDGDLGAIGMGHFMNAMMRGERWTTIFLNNACYGQTKGQMAPTTLLGMRTTTTQDGRDPAKAGYPLHVAELAATMKGVVFSARCTVNTPANFQKAKKTLKTAFQKQLDGPGMSVVELLSACPSNWGLSPPDAIAFLTENMIAEYPLGEFKNAESIG